MVLVNVAVVGGKDIKNSLGRLDKSLKNFKPDFEVLGKVLTRYYGDAPYASEGGVFNEPWQPLDPEYELEKAEEFPGRGILTRTGKMKTSYFFASTKDTLRIMNRMAYFKLHQEGQGVPERVLFKFNQTTLGFIKETISKGVNLRIRRA